MGIVDRLGVGLGFAVLLFPLLCVVWVLMMELEAAPDEAPRIRTMRAVGRVALACMGIALAIAVYVRW